MGGFVSNTLGSVGDALGNVVSGAVDTTKNTLSQGADLYKQIEQPIANNAALIGTGIGAAYGMPQVGAALGGLVQNNLGSTPMSGATTSGLLSSVGGYLQNQSNVAGNQAAAQASQFRPVGVTNTFGTSNFGFDPNGNLTSAGYQLSPQLQGAQASLMSGIPQTLQDQANIQAMGRQYLSQSPEAAAQQWLQTQQNLLAPSRDVESARLANQLQQTGRTGVSVAQGGGLSAANPEQQALANARALQDLGLASQAQQQGRAQYTFGQNLLSSAYDPYTANLKAASTTEGLGQQPFDISTALGAKQATAGSNAANYLKSAGQTNTLAQLLGGAAGNTTATAGLLGSLFGNQSVPSWTTGSDVIPNFSNMSNGADILSPELQALLGL